MLRSDLLLDKLENRPFSLRARAQGHARKRVCGAFGRQKRCRYET